MKPDERLAVIDLGSNSFRLVVFLAGEGWWKRTDEIYEPVRIGEGMGASGELGAEPTARALATLDVFAQFAKASGLAGASVDAVATSAIRDASNAEDFLGRAREHFDLPIRVLSREQEARYGYLAAVNSTTLDDGFVLDLGGGSLQLGARGGSPRAWLGLVAAGHGAHERAIPAAQRPGQAPPAGGTARARRRAARRRPTGSVGQTAARAASAWSASAARCATSLRRLSARRGCRPTACRGW